MIAIVVERYEAVQACAHLKMKMKDLAFFLQQVKVIRQYRAFMRLHKNVCMSESLGAKSPRAQVDCLHWLRLGTLSTHTHSNLHQKRLLAVHQSQEVLSMIRQAYDRDASPEHCV